MAPTRAQTHEVTWWHEDGRLVGRISCNASNGAPCRLGCFSDEDVDLPCDDRDHAHAFADVGHCVLAEVADRVGLLALYDGPSGEPLRSGAVTVQRDAHSWVWNYPVAAAARRLPGAPAPQSSAA